MTECWRQGWCLAALMLALSGCDDGGRDDFCDHHFRYHAGHAAEIARLSMQLDSDGMLQARLDVPVELIPGYAAGGTGLPAALGSLESDDSLLGVAAEQVCDREALRVHEEADRIAIELDADCGPDNPLDRVDVYLLSLLPGLEELEAEITTPATSKHFAINRRCEAAIFRLRPEGEHP